MVSKIKREWKLTLNNPKRILGIFYFQKLWFYIRWWFSHDYIPPDWKSDGETGFQTREYSAYEEYVKHQKSKLSEINLEEYDAKYREVLRERVRKYIEVRGMSVLCLAARIGTEVKSFLDLGCFAVGIDLNPGPDNHFFVHGDFHKIQYPDGCVDIIFTNALDHVFDFDRVMLEIKRVLKPGSLLIIEVSNGLKEGKRPAFYESFYWSKVDDLVRNFETSQFALVTKIPFDYPWDGQHLCFRLNG